MNALGSCILIAKIDGIYKLNEISRSLHGVHTYLATQNTILTKGSADKEEMLQEIRAMLEKLGYRII